MLKIGRKIVLEEILGMLPMLAITFGAMYFLLIRPQKKQQEQVRNMLDSLEDGDSVVTIGGLHGVVDEINDVNNTIVLDCEGIYLTFERRAIARVVSKAEASVVNAEELGTNEPVTSDELEDDSED